MPHIEGRELKRPIVAELYMGDTIILRIDDKLAPEFWLTLQFTPKEFGELLTRYSNWLESCKNSAALDALWLEVDDDAK